MELAWLIVGAACAGLVQGISGFAFSMVALSLSGLAMVLAGGQQIGFSL